MTKKESFPDRAVESAVLQMLSETLALRPEEISLEARILDDLNAESIDLLDMRFRIERRFGFKITNDDLISAFGENTTPDAFRKRFTVRAMCDYIAARLGALDG